MTTIWNKGLTKETDERVKKYATTKLGHIVLDSTREKISKLKKGQIPWMKGRKHTEQTKMKMREAKEGYIPWNKGIESGNHGNGFQKGMIPWNKGLTYSENQKRIISEALIGRKLSVTHRKKLSEIHQGEKHWNWQGGITKLSERIRKTFQYRQWRSDVFTRDDFTCQKCDRRGLVINAHHNMMSFALILTLNDITTLEQAEKCEELWNINNGITLCENCHGVNTKE